MRFRPLANQLLNSCARVRGSRCVLRVPEIARHDRDWMAMKRSLNANLQDRTEVIRISTLRLGDSHP